METRLLILNSDPVFQDAALTIFDGMAKVENRIVRTLSDAIATLLREDFDLFVVDGDGESAVEAATDVRQHFPSLAILCLTSQKARIALAAQTEAQKITLLANDIAPRTLRRRLRAVVSEFERGSSTPAEGVDPCHSLIGNLSQFSAAEILQMSCLSQQSGRFTFKSGRGTSEIYLHHGIIRHALYGELEGEAALGEVFRWRQGRFYFEEGIISQVQTVNRPWTHLLIDNLQKLDETMEMVSLSSKSS